MSSIEFSRRGILTTQRVLGVPRIQHPKETWGIQLKKLATVRRAQCSIKAEKRIKTRKSAAV